MQGHCPIDRSHKAQIGFVAQQRDAPRCGQGVDELDDRRLGRTVIDDDQLERNAHRSGQDGFEAAARLLKPSKHRHDDIDGAA